MHPLLIALQFLTRIPVNSRLECTEEDIGISVLYYPLIGLLIGCLLFITHGLLSQQAEILAAAILLLAWVMITGGLHLDGLADSADAWAGGHGDTGRTLEIMKDPRSGPLAVVVLLLTLLLKFAALTVLVGQQGSLLLVAPILARTAVIALFITTAYVRQNGLGAAMSQYLPVSQAHMVLVFVALCIFVLLNLSQFIVVAVVGLLVFYGLRQLMLQRIGGMTGDTAGAMIELMETAVLISLAMTVTTV